MSHPNFVAGMAFGGGIMFSLAALALAYFLPIGNPDWPSFVKGMLFMPLMMALLICCIAFAMWVVS